MCFLSAPRRHATLMLSLIEKALISCSIQVFYLNMMKWNIHVVWVVDFSGSVGECGIAHACTAGRTCASRNASLFDLMWISKVEIKCTTISNFVYEVDESMIRRCLPTTSISWLTFVYKIFILKLHLHDLNTFLYKNLLIHWITYICPHLFNLVIYKCTSFLVE